MLLNFILLSNKKNDRIKKQSSESMLGTPLPEDAEVPFISSLQGTKARSMSLHNKSSALESFMKFDKKYTRVSSFQKRCFCFDFDGNTELQGVISFVSL